MKAQGEMRFGEGQAATHVAHRRIHGATWLYSLAMWAFVGAVIVAGSVWVAPWLGRALEMKLLAVIVPPWLAFLAFLFAQTLWTRVVVAESGKRLAARGIVGVLASEIEVNAAGLTSTIGQVRRITQWSAISELFPARAYWVFVVQGDPWYVPKRFFLGAEAERAFLAEALGYMDAEARGRSVEAVRLAG